MLVRLNQLNACEVIDHFADTPVTNSADYRRILHLEGSASSENDLFPILQGISFSF